MLDTPRHLMAEGLGVYLPMTTLMPTVSRPSYNTISTGVPSPHNGTRDNEDRSVATLPSIWSIARGAGLCTAASAYSWWSELFNDTPFDSMRDTHVEHHPRGIQHAFFYERDGEPDAVVIAYARRLWEQWAPELLLVHPMATDFAGDYWGADAPAYDDCVHALDPLLDSFVADVWRRSPATVMLLTADHGMDGHRGHGWTRLSCARSASTRSGAISLRSRVRRRPHWMSHRRCCLCSSCPSRQL